ncbi:MAG: chromosome segregation SMC family protein, partial [Acetobacteraceae bacterium]
IVGPNGCGKSNIVEALRFVMGESSAKAMRSGEMEDVIFAGSAARPARNLAEVTLSLEAGEQPLPVPFHEVAELAISRGVERGRGSVFRINGREVRGRDVATLFADLGSGPRASAMVTQGRITSLVGGRAEERRLLLEEAAGITGLHVRRHEAELKLAAAEANLARAEELKGELEGQLASLRRQARQASRYRNLGGAIRAAEAELSAIARERARAACAAAEQVLGVTRLALADRTAMAERAGAVAAEAAAQVPERREAEAAGRAALERARLARAQIVAEEARIRSDLDASLQRLAELDRDLAHGAALAEDAAAAEARLAAEAEEIAAAILRYPAAAEAARAAAEEAGGAAEAAEAAADRAAEATASVLARAGALAQERRRLEERERRLTQDAQRLAAEESRLAAALVDAERLAAAAREEAASEAALREAEAARERCAASRTEAALAHEAAREKLSAAAAEEAGLAAEAEALGAVLAAGERGGGEGLSLAEALSVPSGLEAAASAALGDALEAPARRWRELPAAVALTPLPERATPLSSLLPASPALARALPLIGLIETAEVAERLQQDLAPGQALVTRDGGLWRWDGYSVEPGTESVTAVRMTARNRLLLLRERLSAAAERAATARATRDALAAAEAAAKRAADAAEAAWRAAQQGAEKLRRQGDALRRDGATVAGRREALALQAERIGSERQEVGRALAALAAESADLPDAAAARSTLEAARAHLADARRKAAAARSEQSALAARGAAMTARQAAVVHERQDWRERSQAAVARTRELESRRAALGAEHAALAAQPEALAGKARQALDALEAAEESHRLAQQRLAEAERAVEVASRALRAAEQERAASREQMLLRESSLREAGAALTSLEAQIRERLGSDAQLPDAAADADAEQAARQRLERLMREREAMGPVNLRAEIEASEIETRITAIVREGEELNGAIAKLRGSIGYLNREGRSRLTATFTEVDRHFRALFQRMFGGGRAHLALVGSEDPLAAGLEIYAEPPGKKLSQLSLLSGGEQALIALSLVFAVFRCNPAPIAVLDEVDAPLDDVNVGRFCALIGDVARETGVRMLVATHHPLTMARMERLYGVTMQERGVSRLLSVDLAAAVEMADPPRMAAE